MALSKLTDALNKISSLPTVIRGQATMVKAAFDHDVNVVKDYINNTLIPEIEDTFESKDNITNNRKLSDTGDFKGTWNGLTPVQSDPGIQAIVNALKGDMSTDYSPTSAYALGDYCIYQSVLYKCTTAITIPEPWNASKWTLATMDTELKSKFDKAKITRTAETNDQNYVPSSEVTHSLQTQVTELNDNLVVGTWTPQLKDGNGNLLAQTTQFGKYERHGKKVTANFNLIVGGLNSASGQVFLTGLPFTEDTGYVYASVFHFTTADSTVECVEGLVTGGSITLRIKKSGIVMTALLTSTIPIDLAIAGTITYYIA